MSGCKGHSPVENNVVEGPESQHQGIPMHCQTPQQRPDGCRISMRTGIEEMQGTSAGLYREQHRMARGHPRRNTVHGPDLASVRPTQ